MREPPAPTSSFKKIGLHLSLQRPKQGLASRSRPTGHVPWCRVHRERLAAHFSDPPWFGLNRLANGRYVETDLNLPTSGSAYWAIQTLEHIPDCVFAQDLEGRILVANRAMVSSHGYSGMDALVGQTVFDLFPSETAAAMRGLDLQVIGTGKALLDQEHAVVQANGRRHWVRTSRIPLHAGSESIVGLVCITKDVTESREAEEFLLAQANLLDLIAQSAPSADIFNRIVGVVENHHSTMSVVIQLMSPDGSRLMKPTAPSLPREIVSMLEREPTDALVLAMTSLVASGEPMIVDDISSDPRTGDATTLLKFGFKAVWCAPIFLHDGNVPGVLSVFSKTLGSPTAVQSDVIAMAAHMVSAAIERQQAEERNKFLANHDALTGLPNRMMLEQRLVETLETAERDQVRVGVAFFDLDNFKLINDSLGHAAGDALLKAVAERAKHCIRSGDIVARLGGDEFVMVLNHLSQDDEVNEKRFEHIRLLISAPVGLQEHEVRVTCSMGVAYYPTHARDSSSLIASADMAMYRAKQSGRDNICFFAPGMSNSAEERLSLHSKLREAVAGGEFVLHYQPQVNLETRRIFAVEALVRWNHPGRGLLLPADFMSAADETGSIVPLGDWIFHEACRQNRKWQDAGLPAVVVSINVSARQFQESNIVARVSAALASSGLEPRYLELELTESLIMQDGAMSKMHELGALGVKLAIDDFGYGYSRLGALKHLPVSRLKLDRSFIRGITNDEKDQAIISAIIVMAQKLRMNVTAKGVETGEQVDLLRDLGCREIQGFYFHRPAGPDDLSKLLTANEIAPSSRSLHVAGLPCSSKQVADLSICSLYREASV